MPPKDTPAKITQLLLLVLSWYFSGNGRGERHGSAAIQDSLLLFGRYTAASDGIVGQREERLDGNIVHQGIAVYVNKGSTDQHATCSNSMKGVPNMTFVEVLLDRQGIHRNRA